MEFNHERPIYQQIKEELSRMIARGELAAVVAALAVGLVVIVESGRSASHTGTGSSGT